MFLAEFGFMKPAGSRCLSSSTLVRGCEILRAMSLSLEHDEQFLAMAEEKRKLEATRQIEATLFSLDLYWYEGNLLMVPG